MSLHKVVNYGSPQRPIHCKSNICFLTIIPSLSSGKPFTKGRCMFYLLFSFASNAFRVFSECQILQGLLPRMCSRNFMNPKASFSFPLP